jgi:hypothetical protein
MNTELHKQFFNQPKNSYTCLLRCVWLILSMKKMLTCSLQEFIQTFNWMQEGGGLYQIDLFRMLNFMSVKYRLSFPDEKGLYIIIYCSTPTMGHIIIYDKGKLFDPCNAGPVDMTLPALKEAVSSIIKPSTNLTVLSIEIL